MIDKIAAGEVIERPASIIKELVENSIDAGAKNIIIEIKNGGISFIKIIDDGHGIEKSQVKTAFLRHATSKLREFEEIGHILTLGFRGEALSSIASISQVEMTTKSVNEEVGSKIIINGGKVISEEDYPATNGTTFVIRNVFFNTPVRKKFLKKETIESGYISDIINRFALGNPSISFKYINNGSVILNTPGNNDLKTAMFYVYGKDVANKLLEIKHSKDGFILNGFVGSPEISRGNRNYSNLFINGRYVKSKLVQDAIEEAFEGKLMIGKFPVYALNIITPANTVDVNVHPTKMEVRFENEIFMFEFIKKGIEKTLKNNSPIPEFTVNTESPKLSEVTENKPYNTEAQKELEEIFLKSQNMQQNSAPQNVLLVNENPETTLIENNEPSPLNIVEKFYLQEENTSTKTQDNFDKNNNSQDEIFIKEIKETSKQENHSLKDTNSSLKTYDSNKQDEKDKESLKIKNIFHSYKIIGQIFNTYWIVEKDSNMYMIDQHALHEKFIYENFIKSVKEKKVVSQPVLSPCTIKVSDSENEIIKQNLDLLKSFGFGFEEFGFNCYVIREVPFIFNSPLQPEFFTEIVDILSDKAISSIYSLMLDKIASISCKSAIKGNDKISFEEAEAMIEQVLNLENPFNCPHGRPTIIKFSKYEVEKMFKRIQN